MLEPSYLSNLGICREVGAGIHAAKAALCLQFSAQSPGCWQPALTLCTPGAGCSQNLCLTALSQHLEGIALTSVDRLQGWGDVTGVRAAGGRAAAACSRVPHHGHLLLTKPTQAVDQQHRLQEALGEESGAPKPSNVARLLCSLVLTLQSLMAELRCEQMGMGQHGHAECCQVGKELLGPFPQLGNLLCLCLLHSSLLRTSPPP